MRDQRDNHRAVVLAAMPGTQVQIVAASGLSAATVSRWCEDLLARREAHVGGWHTPPHGGPLRPVYHAGHGPRARKPRRLSDTERMRRYRRQLVADGKWEDVLAKRRAKTAAGRVPRADPLATALFGV